MLRSTASQRQLASLVSSDCICNYIHNATNVAQFIFHACSFQLIYAKLDIDLTSAP